MVLLCVPFELLFFSSSICFVVLLSRDYFSLGAFILFLCLWQSVAASLAVVMSQCYWYFICVYVAIKECVVAFYAQVYLCSLLCIVIGVV